MKVKAYVKSIDIHNNGIEATSMGGQGHMIPNINIEVHLLVPYLTQYGEFIANVLLKCGEVTLEFGDEEAPDHRLPTSPHIQKPKQAKHTKSLLRRMLRPIKDDK